MTAESAHPRALRQLIQQYFDLQEIRDLCFDLAIDYEELGEGLRKSTRIVELIKYVQRQGRLHILLNSLREQRPHVDWPAELTDIPLGLEPGQLINVPPLPLHFLPREDDLAELKAKVLANTSVPVGVTGESKAVGIQGMGGIGKTILAIASARDASVRAAFPDGIVWLSLGQTPNLVQRQSDLAVSLGDIPYAFEDVEQGKSHLTHLLATKACLIILDDVWQVTHAQAFNIFQEVNQSRLLLTTRDAALVTNIGADEYRLDVLSQTQALTLLSEWSETQRVVDLPETAGQVAAKCDYLPLALVLCGAQVREGMSWEDVLTALEQKDLTFFDHPQGSVMASMQLSMSPLSDIDRTLYQTLAAIPEDRPVPEAALTTLWTHLGQIQEYEARQLVTKFVNKALLQAEGEPGQRQVTLHDLQYLFLQQNIASLAKAHYDWLLAYQSQCQKVVDGSAMCNWATGPDDGYFFQNLVYHLREAKQEVELRRILSDFNWLQAKLNATDITAVVADYDYLITDHQADPLRLVQGALRLSTHVLATEKRLLAAQLLGRLLSFENEVMRTLLKQAGLWRKETWLRPLTASLMPPGGPLIRILTGQSDHVSGVAVTPDGTLALSACLDGTVKIWEIETGQELHTLRGHDGSVNAVLAVQRGRLAVSASADGTVKVWEVKTGQEVRTLKGHRGPVNAVATTADGSMILSASSDGTVKIWWLETGNEIRTLRGHTGAVNTVAVTADGRLALSGSADRTVKVWEIVSGQVSYTLRGHGHSISAVAVPADGRLALSASYDFTVKVWDLFSGQERHSLTGHAGWVNSVVVTEDGRLALSAANDGIVKLWDVEKGQELYSLKAHTRVVTSVATTADGRLAVSSSAGGPLKVWDIETGRELGSSKGHADRVNSLAVTADGRLALSASADGTVKAWNVPSGQEIRTFEGCMGVVTSVAISADGRLAVCASSDGTIIVWEVATGTELHTLISHEEGISAVTITGGGQLALSTSGDGTMSLWVVESGERLRTLKGPRHAITSLAITADARRAFSAHYDNSVRVWDLETGKILHTFKHMWAVKSMAITADGRLAVSASDDNTVKVWEMNYGEVIRTLIGHTDEITAVAITLDGYRALSASRDRTVKVWEIVTGHKIASFHADAPVHSCIVTPNSGIVIAGDAHGHVHFLKLEEVHTV